MVAALHSYTHPTWLRFWGTWSLVESKWCIFVKVDTDNHLKLLPTSMLDIQKCLHTLICCPLAYSSNLTQFYPPYLAQILGYVVTCGVLMMHFCQGWCQQPTQTASHIHIGHIQSDWAHWYAIHGHTVSSLHSYTHPNRLRCWGSGSLVESKWCDYVMVEVDNHLKLLPTSILDIHAKSIWAHWCAVHRHVVSGLHRFTHPTWVRFLGSGSLLYSKYCDYVKVEAHGHLKLLPTSIFNMYKVFEHIDMLSICLQYQPYTVIPTLFLGSDFGVLGHYCGVKMMWLCHG